MVIFVLFVLFVCKTVNTTPNIVLVITDDQDVLLDGLKPMTNTLSLVANKGVTFANSFANCPICCPSRSIILTGKYLHNTRVFNNSLSGNCSSRLWQKTHEPYTIASILKNSANYNTFYAGKYLNQYGHASVGGTSHIPEGYDWWIGLKGNSVYYNYTLSINGTAVYFENEYLTDILKKYTLDFLNQNHVTKSPFFMTIATPAPHQPFTPAERHRNTFPGTKALRTPSFNFTSKDKHWIVSSGLKNLPENVSVLDLFQKLRMQSLLAVDDLVESLVMKLTSLNILHNTYIIFTSDNGYHLGQFTQPYDKRQPYETDIRIPLLIRGPGIREKSLIQTPVSLVDLAPTILNISGIENIYEMDGNSFFDIIRNKSNLNTKNKVFVEYYGEKNNGVSHRGCNFIQDPNISHCTREGWCKCADSTNNTFSCVITFKTSENIKFCKFKDNQNFVEVYDLKRDPYELKNIFNNLNETLIEYYETLLEKFGKCKGKLCNI